MLGRGRGCLKNIPIESGYLSGASVIIIRLFHFTMKMDKYQGMAWDICFSCAL